MQIVWRPKNESMMTKDDFRDAVREIERKTGKELDKDQREKLHDAISGMDYGYHEIVEEGYWMFK